jgi:ribosomal protein L32
MAAPKKKVTSSRTRSQRQKASEAKVSNASSRQVTGSAKVTTGSGKTTPKLPSVPKPQVKASTPAKPKAPVGGDTPAKKAMRLANRAAKGYGTSAGKTLLKGALKKAAVPLAMASEIKAMQDRSKSFSWNRKRKK